jgi:hypothetical protein
MRKVLIIRKMDIDERLEQEALLDEKQNSILILKSQKSLLQNRLEEENYFSLLGNQKSLLALGEAYDDNIVSLIKDALYEINISEEKKLIIPYEDMVGVFLINQVKVLNHKWIIANFSNGSIWGELLIEYNIDEKGISFKTMDHLLYPIER